MNNPNLIAYHGDPAIKAKYVKRMKDHMDADELVRRVGFENGRGCAVGCTLNYYDHTGFETELGIPEWLAHLCDKIHENSSDAVWPTFQLEFLSAVKPGVSLDEIRHPLCEFIQRRNLETVKAFEIPSDVKADVTCAIERVISLHAQRSNDIKRWAAAWAAAREAKAAAWAVGSATEETRATEWAAGSATESAAASISVLKGSSTWEVGFAAGQAAWAAAGSAVWEAVRAVVRGVVRGAVREGLPAAGTSAKEREYDAIAAELLRLVRKLEVSK